MSELGEIFKFQNRELLTVPSPEGCDGCYLKRRDDLSCEYHEPETDACTREQRGDNNDVRYTLAGPHIKVTSTNYDCLHNIICGSIHRVVRFTEQGYVIKHDGEELEIRKEDAQPFRIRMTADYMANGLLFKKNMKYVFVSGNALCVEVLLPNGGTATLPTDKIEFYD